MEGRSSRLVAIDLMRGLFLLVIIIDHFQKFPGVFDFITGRGLLWASAAEGFFFISGMMLGFVRGRREQSIKFSAVAKKLLKRGGMLYVWCVGLTIFFTFAATFFVGNYGLKPGNMTDVSWWTIVTESLKLQYVYGWADFLQYYSVFLIFAPLAIILLRKNLWWLVIIISLAIWTMSGKNFYLSWQLLFFTGCIAGYYLKEIESFFIQLPRHVKRPVKIGLIVGSLVTIIASVFAVFGQDFIANARSLPVGVAQLQDYKSITSPYFDKDSLPLPRMSVFLLWFSTLYFLIRKYEKPIKNLIGGLLIPLGQNSLYVYILQAFLIFSINLMLPYRYSMAINFLLNCLILYSIWLMVKKRFLFRYIPR